MYWLQFQIWEYVTYYGWVLHSDYIVFEQTLVFWPDRTCIYIPVVVFSKSKNALIDYFKKALSPPRMDGYGYYMTNRASASSTSPAAADPGRLAQLLGSIGQTWQGSFSVVSRLNFARKYAFESSRRDLHMHFFSQLRNLNFFMWNSGRLLGGHFTS